VTTILVILTMYTDLN